jgi:hypothetical protein
MTSIPVLSYSIITVFPLFDLSHAGSFSQKPREPFHMLLGLYPQVQTDPIRSPTSVRSARLAPDLDVQGLVAHILGEHGRHGDRHFAAVDRELLLQPSTPNGCMAASTGWPASNPSTGDSELSRERSPRGSAGRTHASLTRLRLPHSSGLRDASHCAAGASVVQLLVVLPQDVLQTAAQLSVRKTFRPSRAYQQKKYF